MKKYTTTLLLFLSLLLCLFSTQSTMAGLSKDGEIPVDTPLDSLLTMSPSDHFSEYLEIEAYLTGHSDTATITVNYTTNAKLSYNLSHAPYNVQQDGFIIEIQERGGISVVHSWSSLNFNYTVQGNAHNFSGVDSITLPPGIYDFLIRYSNPASNHYAGSCSLSSVSLEPPQPPEEDDVFEYKNYIATRTYTSPDSATYLDVIQYYDGLGRPSQTVQRGVTPSRKDLISLRQYDGFGRESKAWLPLPLSGNNGMYVEGAGLPGAVTSFYGGDTHPFSEPVYEPSPLNRVVKQFGPGQAWRTDGGHALETAYLTNDNADLKCPYYFMEGDNLKRSGYYPPGELYVTRYSDEDGKVAYEFKDKLETLILQRRIEPNAWSGGEHDTYYVYDNFHNLRYVLPPAAVDELPDGTYDEFETAIENYAYLYKYDSRKRCTWKKLPGADPVYYLYDKADRLVFSQDGENRLKGEWRFFIPDALGRTVLQGVCSNIPSAATLAETIVKAEFSGSPDGQFSPSPSKQFSTWGYTLSGITTSLGDIDLYQAHYYDNYLFRGMEPFGSSEFDYETSSEFQDKRYGTDADLVKSKGLLTGTLTALLDDSGEMLPAVFYYDRKGQPIQSIALNHLAGFDKEYINYSFTGNPVWKKLLHTVDEDLYMAPIEQTYNYHYDHAGRLVETTCRFSEYSSDLSISYLTYNELGQVTNKYQHNGQQVTSYQYNIRGWLKEIDSEPFFSQSLHYEEAGDYSSALYNGNISWTSWSRQNKSAHQRYFYNYDGLNRLLSATYTNNSGGDGKRFDESYDYDKMGNMTYLGRHDSYYGHVRDAAIISYDGNRLSQLNDFGDPNKGFGYCWAEEQFAYNRNAALTKDIHRGIDSIRYNYMNLPEKIWFDNGACNEYLYDATGTKRRVIYGTMDYSFSVPGGTGTGGQQNYLGTDYCGSVIYENGQLSRVLNPEGYTYFVPVPDTYIYYYFVNDYQGSVRAVTQFLSFMQGRWPVGQTDYYPYGLPFGEEGNAEYQPYKREGKELDEMHGLNWYDQGARFFGSDLPVTPTMDPLAEMYYGITPYAQWANNPVRYVDPDGRIVIFINGMHTGTGGTENYWGDNGAFANATMKHLNDNNAMYIDGSVGGWSNIANNRSAAYRMSRGQDQGELDAANIIKSISDKDGNLIETIKIITHSMGGAYAKGYVKSLLEYFKKNNISTDFLEFEADFAPYQPTKQQVNPEVDVYQFSHNKDRIAGKDKIEGAEYMDTSGDKKQGHGINTFMEQIKNLPAGRYRVENGQIVPM